MKSLLVLLILVSIGWIGGGSYYWACVVRGHCENMPSQNTVVEGTPSGDLTESSPNGVNTYPSKGTANEEGNTGASGTSSEGMNLPAFGANFQGKEAFHLNGNFPFKHSAISGELSPEMSASLNLLAAHLKEFPDRTLRITGLFEADEATLGQFANMGLARADFVMRQLESRGIDPNRILRLPKQVEKGQIFGDEQMPAIEFYLQDKLNEASGIVVGNGKIPEALSKSMNLYFSFNRFDLRLTDEERNQISQMIQFLKENPNRRLSIIGHTDMSGDRESNQFLGHQRADQAKAYFIQFGMDPKQIDTDSKGQEDPIGDNATKEGRRKNRRAEIRLK